MGNKTLRVLGIIPARGGSKALPRKNVLTMSGKPLIAWTIEAALQSALLTKVVVSTDDQEISDTAIAYGAEVPFIRPVELATDTANAVQVLQHALLFCKDYELKFNAVMMLQPTTPLRTASDIDNCIEIMQENTECDSVISVTEVGGHHPARMKYLENGVLIDPDFCEVYENQPRQELKPMYIRNGAIYLVKVNILLEYSSLKGACSMGYVMPPERSVNIDSKFDFELAVWLFNERKRRQSDE